MCGGEILVWRRRAYICTLYSCVHTYIYKNSCVRLGIATPYDHAIPAPPKTLIQLLITYVVFDNYFVIVCNKNS